MVDAKVMLQFIGQAMEEGITGVTCHFYQFNDLTGYAQSL
ncbi:MAG: hypothetical protein RLZZ09_2103 [Pseudomonadota bacterium]|jgi:hypothetical protein